VVSHTNTLNLSGYSGFHPHLFAIIFQPTNEERVEIKLQIVKIYKILFQKQR
jgi:hypothetical protein